MLQLLKLPVLIEHYNEHKRQNEHLSLWGFLCMHYANGNEKDADYDKDMKLPFKTHTENINLLLFVTRLPDFGMTARPEYIPEKQFAAYHEDFINAAYAAAIWQPPRIS